MHVYTQLISTATIFHGHCTENALQVQPKLVFSYDVGHGTLRYFNTHKVLLPHPARGKSFYIRS